ncbi:hypothetical protein [Arsenicicoccus dermatophilus]|uniref:hypothetical protein n=1 Tax=Arsenicicoccus dermatophilus TaxID=1076331 RepID=UPI001F4D3208|nr:hypothetical protein [Arsenicicoccus dermatophilus]MCH8614192.1 hypothetical protein [Arsenicicoccus dermatophilus]
MTELAPVLSRRTREALARRHLAMVPWLVTVGARPLLDPPPDAWARWVFGGLMPATALLSVWCWWREVREARSDAPVRIETRPLGGMLWLWLAAGVYSAVVLAGEGHLPGRIVDVGCVVLIPLVAWDQWRASRRYAAEVAGARPEL